MSRKRFMGNQGLIAQPHLRRYQYPAPLTLIPDGSGDSVIFHVGAKGGAPKNYSGTDTWVVGPDGGPTGYPTVTVGSKTAQGMSGWSTRRHLTLPILSNAIAAWNSYDWVIALIYRYPTFGGGDWGNSPGLFSLGKGLYANQPGVYYYTEPAASGVKKMHRKWYAAVPYDIAPSAETVDSSIHIDLMAHVAAGGNNYLLKHDGGVSTAGACGPFSNTYDNTWRAFLGVYGYTPMTTPATNTTQDSWSDGVIVEAKMWIHSPSPTLAYLDALYASIIS